MSSPDQEQDIDIVQDNNDLPTDLRRQIAAWVEHGTLPALRRVSRGWKEAADLAVRQLKDDLDLWPYNPEQARLSGQRRPNLDFLDLSHQFVLASPDKDCGDLMSSLMPLTRLQHLGLGIGAALLPEGQDFMIRQTRLLSLCLDGSICDIGAINGVLHFISRLSHLTWLQCDLQGEYATLAGVLLEPATDEGVRSLSSLQSLEHLTLTVGNLDSPITGQALSSIGSLHQLTHLTLRWWPMEDEDLGHLTHLQLLSLELQNFTSLTPYCLMDEISLFTSLHYLNIDQGRNWWTHRELDKFLEVVSEVMPSLTDLYISDRPTYVDRTDYIDSPV